MAFRPNNLVVEGELDNTQKGIVKGWLEFSDRPDRVLLFLRGNCRPDLAGWKFRIKRLRPVPEWEEPEESTFLNANQSGDAGDITADQTLKDLDCPVEELLARSDAGEPPPYVLRKALYLEWYSSRNGRVVIQDTRLGVERLGERAFELTGQDLKQAEEEAREELAALEAQGVTIESETIEFPSFWPTDEYIEQTFGREALRICQKPGTVPLVEAADQLPGPRLPAFDPESVDLMIVRQYPGYPPSEPSRRKVRELFDPPLCPPTTEYVFEERYAIERRKLELLLLTKDIRLEVCRHFGPKFAFEWAGMGVLWENVPRELTDPDRTEPVVYRSSDNCDQCREEMGDRWRAAN